MYNILHTQISRWKVCEIMYPISSSNSIFSCSLCGKDQYCKDEPAKIRTLDPLSPKVVQVTFTNFYETKTHLLYFIFFVLYLLLKM